MATVKTTVNVPFICIYIYIMPKSRMMGAGLSSSSAYNASVNGNQGGGNSKGGIPPPPSSPDSLT